MGKLNGCRHYTRHNESAALTMTESEARMKNGKKVTAFALGLSLLAGAAAAQEDILSRYKQSSGRDLGSTDTPPIGTSVGSSGASNPDASATVNDPYYTGEEVNGDKIDAFNQSLESTFPMTPEMIQRYREVYEKTQKAVLERPEPKGSSTTGLVSLEPGEPAPVILVAPSIASVVGFYDATGAAWPINQYVVGNSQDFQVVRLGENSNNLTISPNARIGYTNIVVLLQGMDKPVTIRLNISETEAAYRRDIQVMKLGPNAETNTAIGQNSRTVEEAGSSMLLAALSGVSLPSSAQKVPVEGADARAWLIGDDLYVRSRNALLTPSWSESMSGPDGIRVYRINPASVALFSVNGKIVRAALKLPWEN